VRRLPLVLTVAALAGCPAPDPAHGLATTAPPAQVLDYNEFVCAVEPVLIRRCSYLACHGSAEHALRIYSPGKLRLTAVANRDARDARLSADEIARNFESTVGMVYDANQTDRQTANDWVPLLVKPVRASFGGSEHHGVGIFPVYPAPDLAHDPEWGALAAWVAGKKQPSPVTPDCAVMFMKMGLQPK
jgi:hypothetical protein